MISSIATIILLGYITAVAVADLRTHRIPNLLSLGAALIGLALQLISNGGQGMLNALGGLSVGLIIFLPLYGLRAFGAGDVKAMATIGIFLGPLHAAQATAMTLMAGGVIGMFVLWHHSPSINEAWHRLLGTVLAPTTMMRRSGGGMTSSDPVRHASRSDVQKFPYGVAIATGTAITLWWTGRFSAVFMQLSN